MISDKAQRGGSQPRRLWRHWRPAPAQRSILTRTPPEPWDPHLLDAVRTEQVRLLYADGVGYISTLVIAGLLVAALMWQHALTQLPAVLWLGAMAVQSLARMAVREAYVRADPPADAWRPWARWAVVGIVASGVTWGAGMPFLLPPTRFDLQAMVVAMMVVGTYGMVGSTGAYLPAFAPFFVPFAPLIIWFAVQGDVLHVAGGAILLAWLPSVASLAQRYNANLVAALRLRFENAALADDLRAQKQVAEQSNLAKSRFLAAASHDLRQPVHALGMFIGALRGHRLSARSRELVAHMDSSVGALNGLFGSLLDISRLDAGVIEARPGRLAIQPMLARIGRDLAQEAAAKGVALRLVPTSAEITSDPVLLERILRNLIGNAVVYTPAGGRVLVGLRRRGGGVGIEVRDTGPGIQPELQELVFEEFYQIGNPDRDRSRGLGLGLPIVRRLCGILDHPLTMESTPGRGTCFTVQAPRLPTLEDRSAPVPAAALVGPPTGFILAMDDEPAIRVAMIALLESWGHRVVAAAGPREAIADLAGGPPPDLIISDYRLRDGLDGLTAIRQVQDAIAAKIPAILVTGDTAPENIRVALASGYPLLHKPLSDARLRAAITSLLRRGRLARG